MDINLENYIGFTLEEVKSILRDKSLSFTVIEVWDRKKTKMGNDLRVINIKDLQPIEIYVSYF